MITYIPNYYKNFKCIACECKHTCCAGWEIDIDEKSLTRFYHVSGTIGDKLRENIVFSDIPHFKTIGDEAKCPFLQKDGLCEIYKNLGEEALCQICKDHPRFKNFLQNRTEIGLGLCCEEACRVILNFDNRFKLVIDTPDCVTYSKEESTFFDLRDLVFEILQDRTQCLNDRLTELCDRFEISNLIQITDIARENLKYVEIINKAWLDTLEKADYTIPSDLDIELEQLLCYLVFRHLSKCFDGYGIKQTIKFILVCFKFCVNAYNQIKDIYEAARLFSSEVEYSQENIDIILDLCK